MRFDQNSLPSQVSEAVSSVMGSEPAALHSPTFDGNELLFLRDCLESTYVSSVGPYVDQFERDLSDYTGSKYVICVVNGTSALHIALLLAGVQKNDEVLVPALTFIATANAVSFCGAIPHFVDSDIESLGISVEAIRLYLHEIAQEKNGHLYNKLTGRRIKAIVPMHTFGHPSDMEKLTEMARSFHLEVVEDAAESLGSKYKERHTGTFGNFGILSFNGNKIITTGGGGAILTSNKHLAAYAKHITTTAKLPHKWEFNHDEVGFNYRLPNLNAALGCAQLQGIEKRIQEKRGLYEKYKIAFSNISGVTLFEEKEFCRSNYWLQTLILDTTDENMRDLILEKLNLEGYMSRPSWNLLNEQGPYRKSPSMTLENAKHLSKRIINVPSVPKLAS
jgi:perosamine synthetase